MTHYCTRMRDLWTRDVRDRNDPSTRQHDPRTNTPADRERRRAQTFPLSHGHISTEPTLQRTSLRNIKSPSKRNLKTRKSTSHPPTSRTADKADLMQIPPLIPLKFTGPRTNMHCLTILVEVILLISRLTALTLLSLCQRTTQENQHRDVENETAG